MPFYHLSAASLLDGQPQTASDPLRKAAEAFLQADRGKAEVEKAVMISYRQGDRMVFVGETKLVLSSRNQGEEEEKLL